MELWRQLLSMPTAPPAVRSIRQAYPGHEGWNSVRNAFFNDDGTARLVAVDRYVQAVAKCWLELWWLAIVPAIS